MLHTHICGVRVCVCVYRAMLCRNTRVLKALVGTRDLTRARGRRRTGGEESAHEGEHYVRGKKKEYYVREEKGAARREIEEGRGERIP